MRRAVTTSDIIIPTVTVSIGGHTESKGADAYNQKLSERRAKAVQQYLMSHGAEISRLSKVAKGEKEPIAENMKDGKDNPEGRAINRRVELKVKQPEARRIKILTNIIRICVALPAILGHHSRSRIDTSYGCIIPYREQY